MKSSPSSMQGEGHEEREKEQFTSFSVSTKIDLLLVCMETNVGEITHLSDCKRIILLVVLSDETFFIFIVFIFRRPLAKFRTGNNNLFILPLMLPQYSLDCGKSILLRQHNP